MMCTVEPPPEYDDKRPTSGGRIENVCESFFAECATSKAFFEYLVRVNRMRSAVCLSTTLLEHTLYLDSVHVHHNFASSGLPFSSHK